MLPHITYYYQIVAFNISGESSPLSKSFTTSNSTPVLSNIGNLTVDFNIKKQTKVTATDADVLTFKVTNKPGFVSFQDEGDGTMLLIINPGQVMWVPTTTSKLV